MPLENDYYKGAYKSSQLYKLKGPSRTQIPDSTSIPNVAPLTPATIPDDTTQPTDNFGNLASLVGTLTGGTTGTISGQLPGTDFNMGAVNMPEPSQLNPRTSSKEFDADKFARMAGAFGAAIAPRNSWQSRLGTAASGLAAENLKGRAEQEQSRLEAPGKALDMELTQARIDKLKREDKEKRYVTIGSGGLYDTQTGQTISPAEKLKDKKPTVRDFQIDGQIVPHQLDEETGEWKPIKGMGGPKWNPKSGSEAGTKPSLYTSSMNQILKEYGGAGTSFKTDPTTGEVSFSTGGEKAYKEMAQQAKDGDPKAKKNLERYESLKQKLFSLAGEEVSTDTSSNKPSWKDYR